MPDRYERELRRYQETIEDLTRKYGRQMQQAMALYQRYGAEMQRAAELAAQFQATEITAQIDLMARSAQQMHRHTQEIARAMSRVPTDALRRYWDSVAPLLALAADVAEFYSSDCPYTWVRSVPFPALARAKRAYETEGTVAALDALGEALSGEDIHLELLQRTRECPTTRDHEAALSEALWAHREGRYYVSIPTLIAQTEGMLRRIAVRLEVIPNVVGAVGKKPYTSVNAVLTAIEGKLDAIVERLRSDLDDDVEFRGGSSWPPLWGPFVEFLREQFFGKGPRDPVMHGECADYGKEQLSIECILALNETISAAEQVEALVSEQGGLRRDNEEVSDD